MTPLREDDTMINRNTTGTTNLTANRWSRRASCMLAAVAGMLLAVPGMAQPPVTGGPDGASPMDGGPGARPGPGVGGRGGRMGQIPTEEAALREYIARRLADIERSSLRLREALGALDRGTKADEVARQLQEASREALREGAREWAERREGAADGEPGRGGARQGAGGGGGPGGSGGERSSPMSDLIGPMSGPRLSAEERQRVRAFINEHRPELMSKIDELSRQNGQAADRLIDGLGARIRGLDNIRQRDPEEFQMRVDEMTNALMILKAGRDVVEARRRGAPAEEIEASRATLRSVMDKQLDVRAALQRKQIESLRKRIEKMQEELNASSGNREAMIEDRMERFLKALERGPRGGPSGPGGPGGPGDGGPPASAPAEPR